MYQQGNVAEQSLPNGLPPLEQNPVSQEKAHFQFNGVHSSQSSRSSSPLVRLGQIPTSQLPPSRPIPTSQLPPSRSPVLTVTQKIAGLNLNQITPSVNPKFSTSTPNLQSPASFSPSSAFSPISSTVPKQKVTQSTTELQNVPLANLNNGTSENVQPQPYQQFSQGVSQQQRPAGPNLGVSQAPPVQNQFNPQQSAPLSFQPPPQQRMAPQNQPQMSQIPLQRPMNQPQIPTSQSVQNYRPLGSFPGQPPSQNFNPPSRNFNPPSQNFSAPPQTINGPPQSLNGPPQSFNSPPQGFNPPQSLPPTQGVPPQGQAQFRSPAAASNLYQPQGSHQNVPPPPQTQKTNLHSNRYPTAPQTSLPQEQQLQYQAPQQQRTASQQPYQQGAYPAQPQNAFSQQNTYSPPQNAYNAQQSPQGQYPGVLQAGFNKYWGTETIDLLQVPNILPPVKVDVPRVSLGQELLDQANCSPDIFRCTMTKIPENNNLLQKSRLPLGVLIHPFRDLSHLPVIQCNVIVRCKACRTYINPFVFFVDSKRWKCNLCYRINELPEEFQYDPVSKSYGDPSRRPEIKSSTIEYIAPAEYMLRPPQPAVYLYLLDVSRLAVESGYLHSVCNILLEELKNLPGDSRTQIGFVTYDSNIHFYSLSEGQSQPHQMTVLDIDDVFLPTPDNLLVNLKDRVDLVAELLMQLPKIYDNTFDTNSALGAALQVAYKMMSSTGGRVTVFQASLPNVGPGALTAREDAAQRTTAETSQLNPANDFYKRLALECSSQQIAVDLFVVNSTYVDIATISGISRFSGGHIHHFPLFKRWKSLSCEAFERCFRRYLTRKIGFEAVMRIRCTRGLAIHTFHGNFFVRSTDLLSLPNISPDAGFGMQVAIEENLSQVQSVCFQAALLYTSSKGERRIRVHTICLPIASTLHDIIHSADQQCIVGLLAKMAVDRSMQYSLSDAREAFINVAIDILSSYKMTLNLGGGATGLLVPSCLKLLPLYISALLKCAAFRTGTATRLDDRVKAMIDMKSKPLYLLIQQIYPDLYPIHNLESQEVILNAEEETIPLPPRLQLSARCLENKGAYLMDTGETMIIFVCPNVPQEFLVETLGLPSYDAIGEQIVEIPELNTASNQRLHKFINYLNEEKPFVATLNVIKDNSPERMQFFERLIEDRVENALSYHEFLQHLKTQVK